MWRAEHGNEEGATSWHQTEPLRAMSSSLITPDGSSVLIIPEA